VFSYVFMKILETAPRRYDCGLALLSFGQSEKVRDRIVREFVVPGQEILIVGCGTGTTAVRCAEKGARVLGFDRSPAMLSFAREKIEKSGQKEHIELRELSVAEMDGLPAGVFDLCLGILVYSELSRDERRYGLRETLRVLRPGGRIVIADETRPGRLCKRLLYGLLRIPLAVLTYLLTQTTTRPLAGIEPMIREAGFAIERVERAPLGTFMVIVARKGR
jgi:demethylmenaquinone methyltransferase/2-methoxy-6-polyprenyl-1,4-benzoquinol methylase